MAVGRFRLVREEAPGPPTLGVGWGGGDGGRGERERGRWWGAGRAACRQSGAAGIAVLREGALPLGVGEEREHLLAIRRGELAGGRRLAAGAAPPLRRRLRRHPPAGAAGLRGSQRLSDPGAAERSTLPDADMAFHQAEYERLTAELERAMTESRLPEGPSARRDLDALLVPLRLAGRAGEAEASAPGLDR